MILLTQILIGLVAALHFYFLYFEMFAWESRGPKVFRHFSPDLFKKTKALAANQGLYNGFLAAGLVWTFFISDEIWRTNIAVFFLSCIIIAGIYGALTADKKIVYIQALPAALALLLLLI